MVAVIQPMWSWPTGSVSVTETTGMRLPSAAFLTLSA